MIADTDLNLANYDLNDILSLFRVSLPLTEDAMRSAKKRVLLTHPDKSRLSPEYFLFFSAAYKKLHEVYSFQNKSAKKSKLEEVDYQANVASNERMDKRALVEDLARKGNFHTWFNEQFELATADDESKNAGYGEWLKSEEGIYSAAGDVTKETLHREIERQREYAMSVSVYRGIGENYASPLGGSILTTSLSATNSFSSSDLFVGSGGLSYQDLRQAHLETILPVKEEQTGRHAMTYEQHKQLRSEQDLFLRPMSEAEAMALLKQDDLRREEQSASLAFEFAKQAQKAQEQTNQLWAKLKMLK